MRLSITLLFLLPTFFCHGQSDISYGWALNFGDSLWNEGHSITIDKTGKILVIGSFSGTVDLEIGPDATQLTSVDELDVFVAKYDSLGNFIRAFSIGGLNNDYGHAIGTDSQGNMYIVGSFAGTVDFDHGLGTAYLVNTGGPDLFIAKYDVLGGYVWAKSLRGLPPVGQFSYEHSLVVDNAGNIYITGYFFGPVDFDPSSATTSVTGYGGYDIYLAKYDSFGNLIFAHSIGGISDDGARSITVDVEGNIFLTGTFKDTVDFDPSLGVENLTSNGDRDIFIAKYGSNGNFVLAKSMGGPSEDEGLSIVTDIHGNVYLAGRFNETADLDPGSNLQNYTSTGFEDVFFMKFDSALSVIYIKTFGGANSDRPVDIELDNAGNLFILGYYYGTSDFNPSSGVYNLTSAGERDIFISKYDSIGNIEYAKSMGGASYDSPRSFVLDQNRNLYVTGRFGEVADFDPNFTTAELISSGVSDVFVAKYSDWTSTSSVTENSNNERSYIFPNPSNGLFEISANNLVGYKVFDNKGRLILSKEGSTSNPINLITEPTGIYFVHIITDNDLITVKLIKE